MDSKEAIAKIWTLASEKCPLVFGLQISNYILFRTEHGFKSDKLSVVAICAFDVEKKAIYFGGKMLSFRGGKLVNALEVIKHAAKQFTETTCEGWYLDQTLFPVIGNRISGSPGVLTCVDFMLANHFAFAGDSEEDYLVDTNVYIKELAQEDDQDTLTISEDDPDTILTLRDMAEADAVFGGALRV